MTTAVRRARTAFLWVGVILPLTMLAVTAIIVTLWLPEIPEPAAIHWGTGGVDGYGPGWTHLVVLAGIALMVMLFAVLAWFAHRLPEKGGGPEASADERLQWSPTARLLGAANLGVAGLITLVTLAGVGSQRGLTDAAQTPDIGFAVFGGFILLIVGSVVGWFAQPATPRTGPGGAVAAAPLPASASERVVWIGTATIARSGLAVLGGSVLIVVALTAVILAIAPGDTWSFAIMLASVAVVILALVVTFSFRVRIGPAGLLVRSRVGWPKIEIAARDIASVRTVDVNPFGEFGGWGLRYGFDGRSGVVLRRGEGIEVTRVDGRRFVVTIDDAETAAAALATAAGREG